MRSIEVNDPLLGRLLAALGVTLTGAGLACGERHLDVDSVGSPSDESLTPSAESGDSDDENAEETDESEKFDLASDGDDDEKYDVGDGTDECELERLETEEEAPDECWWDIPEHKHLDYFCFAPPSGTDCHDEPHTDECIIEAYVGGLIQGGDAINCGPFVEDNGDCCYGVYGSWGIGRPFLVGGRARLARTQPDSNWSVPMRPSRTPQDPMVRRALADVWTRQGLSEHASVAAFSRFILQLLAVGAPAHFVEQAQVALRDEIEHARVSFGLASAYAERPLGPTRLDVSGGLDSAMLAPVVVAKSLATEGCIAETVSSQLLVAARDRCTDPQIKTILARIVEQEMNHVLLAWRALAWLLPRLQPDARAVVRGVFARAHDYVGLGPVTSIEAEASLLADHGYLSHAFRSEYSRHVLRQVVVPAARALLGGDRRERQLPPGMRPLGG
ncbi:MAG: hypothetical protein B7733_23305 [Myxococcales bacterium FL481]|nr:MAG: hypothetical protein B7733_23305 [Myxococcales bacterium FL481]